MIVQKFGGTSVATAECREIVVEKIIKAKEAGKNPVIVVSAMGRKGDPYSTDSLLSLTPEVKMSSNSKERDLIMMCGEIISSVVLCDVIRQKGYEAAVLTGGQAGIITNDNYGDADIIKVVPDKIIELASKGTIPIIAGFQGMTEGGEFTTLGRGASDTTASIIAEAIKAESIEIYKDVDGIMTADPKIVPDAKVISSVTYSDLFQMADSGAKVIHPRAVEIAMRANIPMIIKNTFNDSKGSYICSCSYDSEGSSIVSSKGKKGKKAKIITAISYIPSRVQVIIDGNNNEVCGILKKAADSSISIDIINIFTDKIAFTIDSSNLLRLREIIDDAKVNYRITENCSKVSCIGEKMHGVPGVMARILKCMIKNKINVLQTSDSHTTIACLVKNDDTAKAVMALHEEFQLGE